MLLRHGRNDSSRTTAAIGGEKVEEERAERCYARCKQPKDATIKCNACFIEPTSIIGFEGNDAWKLFCDHATFEEIVMPTARTIFDKPRYDLRMDVEPLPRYPCTGWIMDDEKVCKRERCPDEINEAPLSMCQYYREYAKKWLEATRDNQDYFIHRLRKENGFDEAMTNFMRVLYTARWHRDKTERETARNLLLDYLIPVHAEHKTGILPHYKFLVPMREL